MNKNELEKEKQEASAGAQVMSRSLSMIAAIWMIAVLVTFAVVRVLQSRRPRC